MEMKKNIIFICILLVSTLGFTQENEELDPNNEEEIQRNPSEDLSGERKGNRLQNRTSDPNKKERPPVTAYKIINFKNDTTFVDTTLTIHKDYKYNYLRRDDFGLQPINNVGQTYNSLEKVEEYNHVLPLFGARARHFNYMETEDIRYYNVPTPLTELYFKTTFEQGQQLDAFFTINTSPRLNLSIAYKGVRSLGKYQNALTSTGNFRATATYFTKNNRYHIRTHFAGQDLLNEENGGLSFVRGEGDSPSGIEQYLGLGDAAGERERQNFADRGSITVNHENAESILLGKRFFLDHTYAIIKKTDSTANELLIGHTLDITDKSFQFDQAEANNLYGEAYESRELTNKVALEDFTNQLYVKYHNAWLGDFKMTAGLTDYNYGYNTILSQVNEDTGETIDITNRIKGGVSFIGGTYAKHYKGFQIAADGMSIITGGFDGNYLNASVGYDFNKKYGAHFSLHTNSVAPNYNFLLHQSDYINYNWQNDFKNIESQKVQLIINAKKLANVEASYTKIDNYTYFTKTPGFDTAVGDSLTAPRQFGEAVDLIKVKINQNIKLFGWLGIDNTILYQKVSSGEQVYKVPEIVTRNSVYYQDRWFKNALYLQAGVTFKYYTAYTADGYDPILSEFYVQSDSEQAFFEENKHTFGGFPQFDMFFNAKVRQTRIYFKVENLGEAFSQNNEFSAPGYASRDAVLRFGLVWNFFL